MGVVHVDGDAEELRGWKLKKGWRLSRDEGGVVQETCSNWRWQVTPRTLWRGGASETQGAAGAGAGLILALGALAAGIVVLSMAEALLVFVILSRIILCIHSVFLSSFLLPFNFNLCIW